MYIRTSIRCSRLKPSPRNICWLFVFGMGRSCIINHCVSPPGVELCLLVLYVPVDMAVLFYHCHRSLAAIFIFFAWATRTFVTAISCHKRFGPNCEEQENAEMERTRRWKAPAGKTMLMSSRSQSTSSCDNCWRKSWRRATEIRPRQRHIHKEK